MKSLINLAVCSFCLLLTSNIYSQDVVLPPLNQDNSSGNVLVQSNDGRISQSKYEIGDFAHGGVVFFVDETGQHGLVTQLWNLLGNVIWSNTHQSSFTGAAADGYGGGSNNTAIIVSQNAGNLVNTYAAGVCHQISSTTDGITYGDWYLPSIYELELLFNNVTAVNNIISSLPDASFQGFTDRTIRTNVNYWSSTESAADAAWTYIATSGKNPALKSQPLWARSIRKF